MERLCIKGFAVTAALLALSACAELRGPAKPVPDFSELPLSVGSQPVGELIKGRSLDQLLKDPDIRAILEPLNEDKRIDLDTEDGRERLRGDLAKLRNGTAKRGNVPDALLGIEGVSTAAFLSTLLGEPADVKGKIRDYVFVDATKSGHLSVDMTIERYNKGVVYSKEFLHWDIEVPKGGFTVHKRQGDPNDPDDPFFPNNPYPDIPPDQVQFPRDSLDPANRFSMWARGLDHKLFARGVDSFTIVRVFQQINDDAIVLLPPDNAYYESTENSCIDLLTQGYPPKNATQLLAVDGDYCLGRCAHPFLYNSGGI